MPNGTKFVQHTQRFIQLLSIPHSLVPTLPEVLKFHRRLWLSLKSTVGMVFYSVLCEEGGDSMSHETVQVCDSKVASRCNGGQIIMSLSLLGSRRSVCLSS